MFIGGNIYKYLYLYLHTFKPYCRTLVLVGSCKTLYCWKPNLYCPTSWNSIEYFIKLIARKCFTCLTFSYYFIWVSVHCVYTLLGVEAVTHLERGCSSLGTSRVLQDDWGTSHLGLMPFCSFPGSHLDVYLATCSQGEPVRWVFKY